MTNENVQSSSMLTNESIQSFSTQTNENIQSSPTQTNENIQSVSTQTNENSSITNPYAKKLTRKEKLKVFQRVGLMIFIEAALPLILYYVLQNYMNEIQALLISGIPPFLAILYGVIRKRRVDFLGVIIIISFTVGGILTAATHDPRFFLLREPIITGTIGITCLITLIPIKIGSFHMRPIIFYFSRDMVTGGSFGHSSPGDQGLTKDDVIQNWDNYWNSHAVFRKGFIVMTTIWGVGLVSEVPIRVIIILNSSIDRAILLTSIITYSWLGVLILINTIYSNKFFKRCMKLVAEAPKKDQTSV